MTLYTAPEALLILLSAGSHMDLLVCIVSPPPPRWLLILFRVLVHLSQQTDPIASRSRTAMLPHNLKLPALLRRESGTVHGSC